MAGQDTDIINAQIYDTKIGKSWKWFRAELLSVLPKVLLGAHDGLEFRKPRLVLGREALRVTQRMSRTNCRVLRQTEYLPHALESLDRRVIEARKDLHE